MVGEEADGKENHHENHQPDASPPEAGVHAVIPAEHQHHVAVAPDDDEERDDKPRHGDSEGVGQVNAQVLVSCRVVALCPIGICLAEGKVRSYLCNDPHPDRQAEPSCRGCTLTPAPCLQRVHDAQVAVDADAGEEADAGVEVQVEEAAGEAAPGLPEEPHSALQVVADEEGQCADVEQVSQPQVAHQQAEGLPGSIAGPCAEVPQPQRVPQKPQRDHGQVHGGQEALGEGGIHGARSPSAIAGPRGESLCSHPQPGQPCPGDSRWRCSEAPVPGAAPPQGLLSPLRSC